MIWARFITRRNSTATGGTVTPMISSQPFADEIRWLTGHIPQILVISDGISCSRRPWQMPSKPRNWVTWKCASATSPDSSSWMVILACPSILLTGSMTISGMACLSHPNMEPATSGAWPESSLSIASKIRSADGGQPGRNTSTLTTAWTGWLSGSSAGSPTVVDLDDGMDGLALREQRRQPHRRDLLVERGVLQVGTIQDRLGPVRIAHPGDIGGDSAVTQRNQNPAVAPHLNDPAQVVLGTHRSLDQRDVDVRGELLDVHQRPEDDVSPRGDLEQPFVHVQQRHMAARAAVQPDGRQAGLGHA